MARQIDGQALAAGLARGGHSRKLRLARRWPFADTAPDRLE